MAIFCFFHEIQIFFLLKFFASTRIYTNIFFGFTIFITDMNIEFFTRFTSIVFAAIVSISIPLIYPDLKSLSQCWSTDLQPLFVISNVITAFLFFTLPNWRVPSLFLILLTAFPHNTFLWAHNLFAVGFFFSSMYTLWSVKRLPLYYWVFALSLFLMIFSLVWGEVLAIWALCGYHLHLLTYKERLYNRNL